jgi:hypothetical protein
MIDKINEKYWKRQDCKKDDFVEVSECLNYTAKTLYKVAYCNPFYTPKRILVEVDPIKNKADLGWINGWVAKMHLSSKEIERYQINPEKRYWWISWWNLKEANFLLKNE